MTHRAKLEQAIAHDLTACELGMALTRGATRRKYAAHRKACMAQIAAWNREDGTDNMSDDELLAALAA